MNKVIPSQFTHRIWSTFLVLSPFSTWSHLNQESDQEFNYEKIFNGTVSEKLKIARKIRRNIERLEIEFY